MFPINKDAEDERVGCTLRTREWYGHDFGVKNVRLWRTTNNESIGSKLKRRVLSRLDLSIYNTDSPEGSYLNDEKIKSYLNSINKYKPLVIDGYVSALVLISQYILEHTVYVYSPKSIVTGAEYLSFESRKIIEKAFKCRVYDRYGGTELSLMAHECEKGKFHIMSDKLYFEILKDGRPAKPGELGEVVVTDFTNKALPFIRFKVGDLAVAEEPTKICSCGRTLHLVRKIEGRINDLIILKNGNILVTHVWHKLFRDYPEIKEFQVIQKEYDLFHINIVLTDKNFDLTELQESVSMFLPDSKIEWYIMDQIPPGVGGKLRHSISEVPIYLNQIRTSLIRPAKHIGNIKPYQITSTQDALTNREHSLKLDWNEGTINPPAEVVTEITNYIKSENTLNWYPDISHIKLKEEISNFLDISKESIEIFSGSDSALDYLAKTFIDEGDKVLIISPTYDQFRICLEVRGAICIPVYNSSPFEKDVGCVLNVINNDIRMIYIVNPNNPTGVLYTLSDIEQILQKANESLVIIDEAYIEFCGVNQSAKALLEKYENLIILRTFSKAFCLAGMRLGYILANPNYLEFIQRIRNSKEVSEISQVAGIAALRNWKYYETYINIVIEAKEYFIKEMKKKGYEAYDGHGNYVMVKVKHPHKFITHLRKNKIYIRDRSYLPQLDNFVRVTIGTKEQMKQVLLVVDKYEN